MLRRISFVQSLIGHLLTKLASKDGGTVNDEEYFELFKYLASAFLLEKSEKN